MMDTLDLFKDDFFIKLQRELEAKQDYLVHILNPNEYLITLTEINLLRTLADSYVHYLEENHHAREKISPSE